MALPAESGFRPRYGYKKREEVERDRQHQTRIRVAAFREQARTEFREAVQPTIDRIEKRATSVARQTLSTLRDQGLKRIETSRVERQGFRDAVQPAMEATITRLGKPAREVGAVAKAERRDFQPPPSVVGRTLPGQARRAIADNLDILRRAGAPVEELTPEQRQNLAFIPRQAVIAAGRNLGDLPPVEEGALSLTERGGLGEPPLPGVAGTLLGTPAQAASTISTLGLGGVVRPALVAGGTVAGETLLEGGTPEQALQQGLLTGATAGVGGAALTGAGRLGGRVLRRPVTEVAIPVAEREVKLPTGFSRDPESLPTEGIYRGQAGTIPVSMRVNPAKQRITVDIDLGEGRAAPDVGGLRQAFREIADTARQNPDYTIRANAGNPNVANFLRRAGFEETIEDVFEFTGRDIENLRPAAQRALGRPALGPGTAQGPDVMGLEERFVGEVPEIEEAVVLSPLDSLKEKIGVASRLDKGELTPLVKGERRLENIERTAAYQTELRRLVDEGVPFDDAIQQARAKLAGPRFDITREGFNITPDEERAFNEVLLSIPPERTYTMDNVYTAVWEGASGRRLRDWEVRAISEVFGEDFAGAVATIGRKTSRKTFDPLAALSDLLTSVVTFRSSLDGSHPLRQGWKMAARHPRAWLDSIRQMGIAAAKEENFNRIDRMITEDDWLVPVGRSADEIGFRPYGDLVKTKQFDIRRVMPQSPEAVDRALLDERIMSRLATAVPGVKQSSRGFITAGNWQRHGVGKQWIRNAMARNLRKTGSEFITPLELDELASVVRRGSGLGEIGQKVSWLRELVRHVMWAPGLRTSGPQLLWRVVDPRGIVLPRTLPILGEGTPMIARQAAAEMGAAWFGAGATAMGLAAAAGMTVVWNPTHTNFGTISIPGTRFKANIWGPEQNLARTIARAIEGEGVDEFGNIRQVTPDRAASEYFLSGLNPALADIKAIYEGRTYDKELTGWNRESIGRFLENELPIFLQDVKRTYELDGFIQAAGATPFLFLGGSAQIYSETGGKFRSFPKYDTASLEITQAAFPQATEPLNLDANEERELQDILIDVKDWLDKLEQQYGPKPDVPYETFIKAYADQNKIDARKTAGLIFLHKARSHPEWINPVWAQYALENEPELSERYPELFETAYFDRFRQGAIEQGLIPAR